MGSHDFFGIVQGEFHVTRAVKEDEDDSDDESQSDHETIAKKSKVIHENKTFLWKTPEKYSYEIQNKKMSLIYFKTNKKVIDWLFDEINSEYQDKLVSFLHTTSIFDTWSSTSLRVLLKCWEIINYTSENPIVYLQNHAATGFYILYTGTMDAKKSISMQFKKELNWKQYKHKGSINQ